MKAITFFLDKLGIASYNSRLSRTYCFNYTFYIRFGRIVNEKSPTVKNQKIDYTEGHNFMCSENLGVAAHAGSFSKLFYSLKAKIKV